LLLVSCGGEGAGDSGGGGRGGRPGGSRGGERGSTSVPVEVTRVERRAISQFLETNGTLEAENDVNIVARTDGPIVELAAEEGMRVREGQLLLRIDETERRAQVEEAEAHNTWVANHPGTLLVTPVGDLAQHALLNICYMLQNGLVLIDDVNGRNVPGIEKFKDEVSRVNDQPAFFYSNGVSSKKTRSRSHGGFDNDVRTMNSILSRILGRPPKRGFTE